MEKIVFTPETEEEAIEFFVVEKARLNGVDYILVTDQPEGDAQALILRDMAKEDSQESLYEIVSEDAELEAVSSLFASLLEDVEFVSDDE